MHSRVIENLEVPTGGGSATASIGVSPARYTGAYFKFTPENITPNVRIENMGRNVLSQSDVLDDTLIEVDGSLGWELVSGVMDVWIGSDVTGGSADIQIFLEYD